MGTRMSHGGYLEILSDLESHVHQLASLIKTNKQTNNQTKQNKKQTEKERLLGKTITKWLVVHPIYIKGRVSICV